MSFNREFFERIEEHIEEYRKHFWTNVVTLSLRLSDRELNGCRLVRCGDELLTFAYYDLGEGKRPA